MLTSNVVFLEKYNRLIDPVTLFKYKYSENVINLLDIHNSILNKIWIYIIYLWWEFWRDFYKDIIFQKSREERIEMAWTLGLNKMETKLFISELFISELFISYLQKNI